MKSRVSRNITSYRYDSKSHKSIPVTGEVEVTIDWDMLFEGIGHRALASKSGRSVYMAGAVEARVVKRIKS